MEQMKKSDLDYERTVDESSEHERLAGSLSDLITTESVRRFSQEVGGTHDEMVMSNESVSRPHSKTNSAASRELNIERGNQPLGQQWREKNQSVMGVTHELEKECEFPETTHLEVANKITDSAEDHEEASLSNGMGVITEDELIGPASSVSLEDIPNTAMLPNLGREKAMVMRRTVSCRKKPTRAGLRNSLLKSLDEDEFARLMSDSIPSEDMDIPEAKPAVVLLPAISPRTQKPPQNPQLTNDLLSALKQKQTKLSPLQGALSPRKPEQERPTPRPRPITICGDQLLPHNLSQSWSPGHKNLFPQPLAGLNGTARAAGSPTGEAKRVHTQIHSPTKKPTNDVTPMFGQLRTTPIDTLESKMGAQNESPEQVSPPWKPKLRKVEPRLVGEFYPETKPFAPRGQAKSLSIKPIGLSSQQSTTHEGDKMLVSPTGNVLSPKSAKISNSEVAHASGRSEEVAEIRNGEISLTSPKMRSVEGILTSPKVKSVECSQNSPTHTAKTDDEEPVPMRPAKPKPVNKPAPPKKPQELTAAPWRASLRSSPGDVLRENKTPPIPNAKPDWVAQAVEKRRRASMLIEKEQEAQKNGSVNGGVQNEEPPVILRKPEMSNRPSPPYSRSSSIDSQPSDLPAWKKELNQQNAKKFQNRYSSVEKAEELAAEQENTVPLWKKELRRLSRGNSRASITNVPDDDSSEPEFVKLFKERQTRLKRSTTQQDSDC